MSLVSANMSSDLRILLSNATKQTSVDGIDVACLPGAYASGLFPSQDLYSTGEWDVNGNKWIFALVLDGHGEDNGAAEFALEELPSMVEAGLREALTSSKTTLLEDDLVSKILADPLHALDERIKRDFLALLPTDRSLFEPSMVRDASGALRIEYERAISGSTACLALVDPARRVHVASLGDCDCFLVFIPPGEAPQYHDMGFHHRASNPVEVARIVAEHPNEPDCVRNGRLWSGVNLSRGLGDMLAKVPADDALLLFHNADDPSRAIELNLFNRTPPYLSNIAEVSHATIRGQTHLVVATDGLANLANRNTPDKVLGQICADGVQSPAPNYNRASEVIWHAWGGNADGNLHRLLTTGKLLDGRVDDIVVVVFSLGK
ncbi:phosphatase 2C-like domain-containing protein [Mycena amicta]|nr:phosphatase 2C-like domain-containing protein [Mycena amicta]